MNPATTNKIEFKVYLQTVGMSTNTINNYLSALNSKVTGVIRDLCNVDLGRILAVADARAYVLDERIES